MGFGYPEAFKKRALEYYARDHSLMECARKFNVSRPSIKLWAKKAGIYRTQSEAYILRDSKLKYGTRWNGGISLGYKKGYVAIYSGRKNGHPDYKSEHLLIVEKVLGRKLKRGEVIHHVNGDGTDNRNENLLVCNRKYHAQIHQKMARLYQQEHF